MNIGQFVVLAAALTLAALALSAWMLVLASVIVGACSTVAQRIVPFAASLAAPEKRGATIGTVMAGVLSGILFSRTLSCFVGEQCRLAGNVLDRRGAGPGCCRSHVCGAATTPAHIDATIPSGDPVAWPALTDNRSLLVRE